MNETPDTILVERAAAGEAAAFDALVERWRDRVFRLALRFFRSRDDAEEVAQETFLHAWRALGSWREQAPFEHWLLRIATRRCLDRLRAQRHDAVPVPDAALEQALRGAALSVAQDQAARALAGALLDRLPPRDRIVLVLMDLEGRSAHEVAVLTGSTRAAVKVRAMRARRTLRRLAGAGPGRD